MLLTKKILQYKIHIFLFIPSTRVEVNKIKAYSLKKIKKIKTYRLKNNNHTNHITNTHSMTAAEDPPSDIHWIPIDVSIAIQIGISCGIGLVTYLELFGVHQRTYKCQHSHSHNRNPNPNPHHSKDPNLTTTECSPSFLKDDIDIHGKEDVHDDGDSSRLVTEKLGENEKCSVESSQENNRLQSNDNNSCNQNENEIRNKVKNNGSIDVKGARITRLKETLGLDEDSAKKLLNSIASDRQHDDSGGVSDGSDEYKCSLVRKVDFFVYLILFGSLLYFLNRDYGNGGGFVRVLIRLFPREAKVFGYKI